MIGVNTAIALASHQMACRLPVSASLLKSNVAKQWLRDQGVSAWDALAHSDTPRLDKSAEPFSSFCLAGKTPPPLGISPGHSQDRLSLFFPPSSRHRPCPRLALTIWTASLVNATRAEADLEDMITEMRGKLRGR